jgi:hypothetical protein
MTVTKKPEVAEVVPQASESHLTISGQPFDRPIVLEYKRSKKNKKQGYSKQFGDAQRTEAKLAKATEKAARAVARGAEVYNDARKKSVSNKRDGALRDFGPNLAEGLSESLRVASSVPVDVADALNTKSSRRLLRSQFRMMNNVLRIWRM